MRLAVMKATPKQWTYILSELLDLIAFTTLYATFELSNWVFAGIAALYALRFMIRKRFGNFALVVGFLFLIFVAIEIALQLRLHPIVCIAYTLPILHAYLHFQKERDLFMGWRMIVGFIELLLAASLAPEATITLLIFAYIVVSTVFISTKVVADEFSGIFVGRALANRALPKNFIRKGLYQSVIILFGAMVIFPLLPRVNRDQWGGWSGKSVETAYTEEVNLNQWGEFREGDSGSVALRIYGGDNFEKNFRSLIPNGLLRSKVLSVFSGRIWSATPLSLNPEGVPKGGFTPGHMSDLTFVKEEIKTALLPVPYGTSRVGIDTYGYRISANYRRNGEWHDARSTDSRFSYHVQTNKDEVKNYQDIYPQDQPGGVHLDVPKGYQTSRVQMLAEKIFKSAKTPEDKLIIVQSYFMKKEYKPSLGPSATQKNIEDDQTVAPLENFLFISKEGHCEYFATAAAILLRMGGVPTRLIAGFRSGRDPVGDVLTIRMGDAHAWVEAYIPNKGWVPFDPTPKILLEASFGDFMRDAYDWFSAKWYQYILNYSESPATLFAQAKNSTILLKKILQGQTPDQLNSKDEVSLFGFIAFFIAASTILSAVIIRLLRFFKGWKKPIALSLSKLRLERRKFDKTLTKSRRLPEAELEQYLPEFKDWNRIYDRLRFGRPIEEVLFNSYFNDLQVRNEALKNRIAVSIEVTKKGPQKQAA